MCNAQNLLWCARKQEAAVRRALAEKEHRSLQTTLEAETAALRGIEKRLEEKRAAHYATTDGVHEAQGELYAVNADVAHIEQQIRHLRENRQRIQQQIATVGDQLGHKVRQAEDAANSLRRWREELSHAMLALEAGKKKAAVETEKLPDADAAFRTCQEKLTETQRGLLLVEQAGRLEESHRDHAGKNLIQLESRRLRLVTELATLSAPDAGELSSLHQHAGDTAAALLQKRETLAQTESLLEAQVRRNISWSRGPGFGAAGYQGRSPTCRVAAPTAPPRRQRAIERVVEQTSPRFLAALVGGYSNREGLGRRARSSAA